MKVLTLTSAKYIFIFLMACSLSCVTVKPVYNSDEQAKAEQGVKDFHQFYNEQNFEAMYNLFSPEAQQATNKDNYVKGMKERFEKYGPIQIAKLSQAKVLPAQPLQVRMIYNVTFKNDEAQEWFIWINGDNGTQLIQLQTFPGHDNKQQ